MKESCVDCPDIKRDEYGYLCDLACGKRTAWLNYKAGYDKRESEFVYNPDYLDFQKGVKTGRELGIREVVEWIEGNQVMGYIMNPNNSVLEGWEAQLKEWNIGGRNE